MSRQSRRRRGPPAGRARTRCGARAARRGAHLCARPGPSGIGVPVCPPPSYPPAPAHRNGGRTVTGFWARQGGAGIPQGSRLQLDRCRAGGARAPERSDRCRLRSSGTEARRRGGGGSWRAPVRRTKSEAQIQRRRLLFSCRDPAFSLPGAGAGRATVGRLFLWARAASAAQPCNTPVTALDLTCSVLGTGCLQGTRLGQFGGFLSTML